MSHWSWTWPALGEQFLKDHFKTGENKGGRKFCTEVVERETVVKYEVCVSSCLSCPSCGFSQWRGSQIMEYSELKGIIKMSWVLWFHIGLWLMAADGQQGRVKGWLHTDQSKTQWHWGVAGLLWIQDTEKERRGQKWSTLWWTGEQPCRRLVWRDRGDYAEARGRWAGQALVRWSRYHSLTCESWAVPLQAESKHYPVNSQGPVTSRKACQGYRDCSGLTALQKPESTLNLTKNMVWNFLGLTNQSVHGEIVEEPSSELP